MGAYSEHDLFEWGYYLNVKRFNISGEMKEIIGKVVTRMLKGSKFQEKGKKSLPRREIQFNSNVMSILQVRNME